MHEDLHERTRTTARRLLRTIAGLDNGRTFTGRILLGQARRGTSGAGLPR